jgi:hypothetical protein
MGEGRTRRICNLVSNLARIWDKRASQSKEYDTWKLLLAGVTSTMLKELDEFTETIKQEYITARKT